MTTQKKIEKKGYKVSYQSGTRNGLLSVTGVWLIKDNWRKLFDNITQAYNYTR